MAWCQCVLGHLTKVIKVEKRNDECTVKNKDCQAQSQLDSCDCAWQSLFCIAWQTVQFSDDAVATEPVLLEQWLWAQTQCHKGPHLLVEHRQELVRKSSSYRKSKVNHCVFEPKHNAVELTKTLQEQSIFWPGVSAPNVAYRPHYETYRSRTRRWIVQNFQILIVSAGNVGQQCLQTASASRL